MAEGAIKRVVAVCHGQIDADRVPVEVYVHGLDAAAPAQLVSAVTPPPGQMDRPGALASRARAAAIDSSFEGMTVVRGDELVEAFECSGSLMRDILDEAYEFRLGRVLCFDAPIEGDAVVWSDARPTPYTDPSTVLGGLRERCDDVLISPEAFAAGRHVAERGPDGAYAVRNEFGVPVVGLSPEGWAVAEAVKDSGAPRSDLVIVAGLDSSGRLRADAVLARQVRTGAARGLSPHRGRPIEPMELEALHWAAGPASAVDRRPGHEPVAVFWCEAAYEPGPEGLSTFDPLGAEEPVDPAEFSVLREGVSVRVRPIDSGGPLMKPMGDAGDLSPARISVPHVGAQTRAKASDAARALDRFGW